MHPPLGQGLGLPRGSSARTSSAWTGAGMGSPTSPRSTAPPTLGLARTGPRSVPVKSTYIPATGGRFLGLEAGSVLGGPGELGGFLPADGPLLLPSTRPNLLLSGGHVSRAGASPALDEALGSGRVGRAPVGWEGPRCKCPRPGAARTAAEPGGAARVLCGRPGKRYSPGPALVLGGQTCVFLMSWGRGGGWGRAGRGGGAPGGGRAAWPSLSV